MRRINSNHIIWGVFISLLIVLLPHTAWAFAAFESTNSDWVGIRWGLVTATAAAVAFECMIAVLTHRLSQHIQMTPKEIRGREKIIYQYANEYSAGLLLAWFVSTLANLSHAVEFAQPLHIFSEWSIPPALFAVSFGGILPTVSLAFAKILSNVVESESAPDIELMSANAKIIQLQNKLSIASQRADEAEDRAKEMEAKFAAMGQVVNMLFNGTKRNRIQAIARIWPDLGPTQISLMVKTSAGYVSDVLKQGGSEEISLASNILGHTDDSI